MAVTVHYIDNLMKLLQLEENQGQDSPIKPVPADVPKIAFVGAGRDDRRRYCSLCKSNREPKQIYTSHWIRDLHGKVTCPVLYANKCQLCGATGPDSHTRSYCPRISEFRKAHRNTPEAYLFENYKSLMERGRARKDSPTKIEKDETANRPRRRKSTPKEPGVTETTSSANHSSDLTTEYQRRTWTKVLGCITQSSRNSPFQDDCINKMM